MFNSWSARVKRNVAICTACFGFLGSFGAAVKAWPTINPYRPALLIDVDYRVAEYKPVLNQLLRWQAEDQKTKLESESAQWAIKMPTESDPQVRDMIKKRVDQLDREKARIDERLKELK